MLSESLLMWAVPGLLTVALVVLAARRALRGRAPAQVVPHETSSVPGPGLLSLPRLAQSSPAGLVHSSSTGMAQTGPEALARPTPDEVDYLRQTLGALYQHLDDQNSQVRAIIDTAAEGIIVVDDQGCIDTFNPAAELLFGYMAQEAHGQHLSQFLPSIITEQGVPRVMRGEQEMAGIHGNGCVIPMSVRVSMMQLNAKPTYTCLVADISERKVAAEKLMNAEARYRDLVETAHDLVWSVDPQGRWTYLNNAARTIYGYDPEEMIGCPMSGAQSPKYVAQDATAFVELLNGKELLHYETVHVDRHGKAHNLSFNAKPSLDADGKVVRISGTARDITKQKAFERQLAYQAEHDSLTGLFNRRYFQQELERLVARVARSGASCALFYIDLDQFKYINDTLGHAAGDRLLIEVSRLLQSHLREGDLFARFGGDEFTVLLYNVDTDNALRVAEHLRSLLEAYKFFDAGSVYNVTASLGVAMIDNNILAADECLAQADMAANVAKSRGRNQAYLHNPLDGGKAGMAADMGWAARVRQTLEQDRFHFVYQPIMSLADGQARDYEVLVRMRCDDGHIILPGGFLPAAERFGLIHGVDRWVVSKAITELARLHEAGNKVGFSINLSGRAFEDVTLLPLIRDLLRDTALNPTWVTFEITETAAIANLSAAINFIGALKDIGCHFALDDFGAGFSSFIYLKHLPVDKLKIDGSFVQGLVNGLVDQVMVQSMNQVAHALGKITIAEFVENQQTLDLLKQYGVDFVQGYHVGQPMSAIHTPDYVTGAREVHSAF